MTSKLKCDICQVEIDSQNGVAIWMYVDAGDPMKVLKHRCREHLVDV